MSTGVSENGNGSRSAGVNVETAGTVNTVINKVVKVTGLGTKEKERIEKLIDNRQAGLGDYLEELETFSTATVEHTPPAGQARLDSIDYELARLKVEIETLDNQAKAEFQLVAKILKDELEMKLQRLDRMKDRLKRKNVDETTAGKVKIDSKYDKKKMSLTSQRIELEQEQRELSQQSGAEKLVRQMIIKNAFSRLRDQVTDTRNAAVEKLWTGADLTEQAQSILNTLPDIQTMRKSVSPGKMVQVLNASLNVDLKKIGEVSKCTHCKSTNIVIRDNAMFTCKKCGRSGTFQEDVSQMIYFPTLEEIMREQESRQAAPALPAPKPSSEVLQATVQLPVQAESTVDAEAELV